MAKIIFITGTDTGAGKTVLTALLLRHLRGQGCNALAVKPFCSGSRADARLLRAMQENLLTLKDVNPFFYLQPVAPAAAGKKDVPLDTVLRKIRAISGRCDVLLVEGSGGLMVPLGKNYTVLDLIRALKCDVLVAARNRLGTINHTLLTAGALQQAGIKGFRIVMMGGAANDVSCRTNSKIIQKMAGKVPIFSVPNLGLKAHLPREIKNNAKKMKKVLARITKHDNFVLVLRGDPKEKIVQQNPLTTCSE